VFATLPLSIIVISNGSHDETYYYEIHDYRCKRYFSANSPSSFHVTSSSSSLFGQNMLSTEELTLLSPPYPASITSRPHARRLASACELAEVSLPSASSIANGELKISPHILVIEMASLMYLGEYIHVQHLWSRSRGMFQTGEENPEETAGNSTQQQLDLLYKAACLCHLWSTGGMYPMEVSGGAATSNMQVENTEESDPYSTMAMKAMQSCIDSGLQPCATYGAQLLDSFRHKVNERLHRSFSRIKLSNYCLRMGVATDVVGGFGWIADPSSPEYLVPDSEWEPDYPEVEMDTAFVSKATHEDVLQHVLSNGDRIKQLSNAVMFMEQTKMNA
jgi:hypothetical protein